MTPKALSRNDVLMLVILGNFIWKVIDTTAYNIVSLLIN